MTGHFLQGCLPLWSGLTQKYRVPGRNFQKYILDQQTQQTNRITAGRITLVAILLFVVLCTDGLVDGIITMHLLFISRFWKPKWNEITCFMQRSRKSFLYCWQQHYFLLFIITYVVLMWQPGGRPLMNTLCFDMRR